MVEAIPAQRVPPQNIEAEMCVLGSILLDNVALDWVLPLLPPDAFYKESHRFIYQAIRDLRDRNEAVDFVTLKEELSRGGKLEAAGGAEYLLTIGDSVPSAANVEHYARIVRDKFLVRRLIRTATEILQDAFDGTDEADKVLASAESRIFELGQRGITGEARHISSFLSFDLIEALQDSTRRVTGVRTGYDDLDSKTNGLQKGEMIVVAGRPSMGKTTLVNNIILHASLQERRPVAFFSLETSANQIAINLLCAHARIDGDRMRRGFLRKEEFQHLAQVAGQLIEAPIYVDDSPSLSIRELRAKARRLRSQHGVEMIAVDYLQQVEGYQRENRQQEISAISRSLKGMARELDVPVVVISQLSRAVESREGNRPRLSDLRESGSIEQDADLVLLLYRPGYYKTDEQEEDDRANLIIAKQRNGPTGVVKLLFRKNILRFENYSSLEGP